MNPSAEDRGGPPTALAHDPATPHQATPHQAAPDRAAPGRATPPGTAQHQANPDQAAQPQATPQPVVVPQQRGPAATRPAPAAAGQPPDTRPPAPRRPTDGVAVAALISGIVPAIPVTLVLGPLALIRISRSGARGRSLAITGLVLAGLWTVAAAIVAAAVITRPPPPRPVTLPLVFSLRAGQCLDSGANGISGVHALSCAQAHDAEVFATFRVTGSRYPGAAALQQRARQGCVSRLSGYLNPQLPATSLAQSFVYPGAGAWSAGERTVVCTVRSTSGPLVGSVRSGP
jgi:hypothetical protein